MNTHDKIDLPPLPKGDIAADTCPVMWAHTDQQTENYAREAIEADRQRRHLKERAQLDAEWFSLRQMKEAYEADRQRRELPDTSFTNWLDRHGYDTTIGLDGDYADTDVAMLHEAYRLGSQRRGEPVAWHSKQYGVVWMAQPVHGTIDIEDHIASEIAQGKMTREEFLEARQWVRDTYYPVAAQPSVPEGWKLVPVEPTADMLVRGGEDFFDSARNWKIGSTLRDQDHASMIYEAMLNTAPTPPADGQP